MQDLSKNFPSNETLPVADALKYIADRFSQRDATNIAYGMESRVKSIGFVTFTTVASVHVDIEVVGAFISAKGYVKTTDGALYLVWKNNCIHCTVNDIEEELMMIDSYDSAKEAVDYEYPDQVIRGDFVA